MSGKKVFLLSSVSGQGVPEVLRAMAREINQRRLMRAQRLEARRPMTALPPADRAARQALNFKAPVVPQPRMTIADVEIPVTAKVKKTAAKIAVTREMAEPKAVAKKAAVKKVLYKTPPKPKPAKGKARVAALKAAKLVPPKRKSAAQLGRAKAKPRPLSRTAKRKGRTQKKSRR